MGYDDGKNLCLLLRSAEGKLDRVPALARELVDARVDVIVAINTPGSRAAVQATKRIPIVMAIIGDAVAMVFVSNLARPGGNVTGVSNISRELAANRLALVKEAVPRAKRIVALFNPSDPRNPLQMEDVQRAAPALKVEIRVKAPGERSETFRRMAAWSADAARWPSGQSQALQPAAVKLGQVGGHIPASGDGHLTGRHRGRWVHVVCSGRRGTVQRDGGGRRSDPPRVQAPARAGERWGVFG